MQRHAKTVIPAEEPVNLLPRTLRKKMHFSNYSIIIGAFITAYVLFTFHLARIEHSCPTIEELARREENKPLLQSIRKMAESANQASLDNSDLDGPLAKLGIKLPIAEPPTLNKREMPNQAQPSAVPTAFYADEEIPVNQLLNQYYAPNNVFYVWCGKRWFEYTNYLSVMSVIREIHPDNIIFFYDHYPVVDDWTYNTWFQEIRDTYPFFRVWLLEPTENPCTSFGKVNQTFLYNLLSYRGGMYIHENTIISSFPHWYRNQTIINALDPVTKKGFVMTQRNYPGRWVSFEDAMARPGVTSKSLQCLSVEQYTKVVDQTNCVNMDALFYPKDIWEREDKFGQLVRKVFYGDPKILQPQKSYDNLIPNIAHVVWIGGGKMDYLFYLCILSLIYVAEVDMVYLHGNMPPTGPFWEQIRYNPKLTLIYREVPATIYGNHVDVLSHVTDIWRVDFMTRYGGIYVDTDTVFVKPLDREIRSYDAVGSYDWTYWNHPFPDTINFGVAIGKRNAKYWHEFQKSMKWFMDKDWSWNGLRQPYRIKERHPELVRIDPRLQVICFEAKCHPTWWPNYHDEKIHHLNSPSITNWLNDTYAFHWTLPTPDELLSEENLLKADSMFADIGKYILKKARLLN